MTAVDRLRRCLVAGGAAMLVTPLLAQALAAAPGHDAPDLADQVLALFSTPGDAGAVGRAYLARHPAEADRDHLLEAVFGPLRPRQAGHVPANPGVEIAARIRDDLDRADVVFVKGWMLSRTQARLCAIVSLV